MRRKDKRGWLLLLGVFVAVFLFTFLTRQSKSSDEEVEAASLANFDPGYIISDYQMGNYNAMSEAEIQTFLSSHGNCRDTEIYKANYYPSLKYHIKDGHFVCLAEETFGSGEAYGDEVKNGESAAHIIWQAAQDYKINPQVILVLLQKEQGLISDSWPNNIQYRSATGYGCPDTAACSSQYYGFKNQVRNAVSLFRTVLNGGWTNYPLGNNYVQYNPNAACGGSVINIRSLATSALYRYTPYQPNAGAIAAGYGTATCGAYGNRNFYLYFEDWFGGITNEAPREEPEQAIEAQTKYEKPVADGQYRIVSKAFPEKVIDIKGGVYEGMMSGLLQIYKKKDEGIDNQVFEIKYDEGNGYYIIRNPFSGKDFDIKGASIKDKTSVQVFTSHDRCNQDWLLEKDAEGYFTIVSRCSSKALDASLSTGFVNIFTKHGGDNQKWKLEKVGDSLENGRYQIVSKAFPEKVVDIKGGVYSGITNGFLQVYKKKDSDTDNQVFEFKKSTEEGYYKIVNAYSGLVVDVKGASTEDKAPTQVYAENGGCNQDWVLEEDEEGYYTIASRCSNKVMDASLSTGFVNIFTKHGGDNQKWKLVEF